MHVVERHFGKHRVIITVQGKPEGDTTGFIARASIDGELVVDGAGEPLEVTAGDPEQAVERMARIVNQRLGSTIAGQ